MRHNFINKKNRTKIVSKKVNILVVGCGNMGTSHSRAYQKIDGFNIVGLVSRSAESRERLSKELGGLPTFGNFEEALDVTKPDAVSINIYPDTHAEYAIKAMEAGAHVFVEKHLDDTVVDAFAVAETEMKFKYKVIFCSNSM